jgi:hypothetical protein
MNTKDFLLEIENSKIVISIDFDGVLHNDNLGFHDGTIYGDPIDGALEFIEKLSNQYKIIIYTCKANPNRPLVNGKSGIDLIWEWLENHKIKQYIYDVTFQKPHAIAYVDDKAIRFENWQQTYKEIKLLK